MPEARGPQSGGAACGPGRGVVLAGLLAEAGVQLLVFTSPGEADVLLQTRRTDLPGVLAGAPAGSTLRTPDGSIRIAAEPNELRWTGLAGAS